MSGSGWAAAAALCFDKLVTTLLIYVNLLLAGYAGAALATAARLRYDPSTYVVAREMFPEHFPHAVVSLAGAALALLGAAHLAVAALVLPRRLRCAVLLLYALAMLALVTVELWLSGQHWPAVERQVKEGRDRLEEFIWHVQMVLDLVVQWYGGAWKLKTILWDIQADAPMNLVVAKRAALLFVVLQAFAAVFAVLAAITGLQRPRVKQFY